jgi:hypothetical protein
LASASSRLTFSCANLRATSVPPNHIRDHTIRDADEGGTFRSGHGFRERAY